MKVVLWFLLAGVALAQPSMVERHQLEIVQRRVEDTYTRLGRRHTPLVGAQLQVDDPRFVSYLSQLLRLVDLIVVLRVASEEELRLGRVPCQYSRLAPGLQAQLAALTPPPSLVEFHRLLLAAVADQVTFLETWSRNPGAPLDLEATPLRRSHYRLRQAYDLLLQSLPVQPLQVQEALFDPLHAVDFLAPGR